MTVKKPWTNINSVPNINVLTVATITALKNINWIKGKNI